MKLSDFSGSLTNWKNDFQNDDDMMSQYVGVKEDKGEKLCGGGVLPN